MARRHEIPTHLNVEDKAFYGLSVRQVMYLTTGCATAYALWNQWPDAPPALRLGAALGCLLLAAALALVRPGGRGLEEWAFVALHYAATPKRAVWRVAEPAVADWRPGASAWQELTPGVAWTGEVRR